MKRLRYNVYAESGAISHERPVMVFLHGLGGGNANWLHQFRALRKQYDLVMIELPSHGRNNVRLSEMKLSYEAVTKKIFEILDDLGVEKATFLGCCLGTMIVKYIVLNHAERVDKYILIAPIGHLPFWFRAAVSGVIFVSPILSARCVYRILARALMPKESMKAGRDVFIRCSKSLSKKELVLWLRLMLRFQPIQYFYWRTMKDEPKGLYVVGELDYVFLPMLKREFEQAQHIVVVENAGHLCNMDQADVVNNLIDRFQRGEKTKKVLLREVC